LISQFGGPFEGKSGDWAAWSASRIQDKFREVDLVARPEENSDQFVSAFWSMFSERLKITLKRSTAFHPQTDGQTEIANQGLEQYLRGFVTYAQDDWVDWLPFAEFAINSQVSEST